MNTILFIVGACLGLTIGAGAVTWARLSDDKRNREKFCEAVRAELKKLDDEIEQIRMHKEFIRLDEEKRKDGRQ